MFSLIFTKEFEVLWMEEYSSQSPEIILKLGELQWIRGELQIRL